MLYDPNVSLLGYQMHFCDLELGLLYFTHNKQNCKTTFAMKVSEFMDLYDGPTYDEYLMGENDCPMYCLRRTDLRPCDKQCSAASVREIVQIINTIHKEITTDQPAYANS